MSEYIYFGSKWGDEKKPIFNIFLNHKVVFAGLTLDEANSYKKKFKKDTKIAVCDGTTVKTVGIADMMQNISHSAVEQQSGIDQIKIAIEEMDTTTQRNAALVEEATASADVLFAQSKELMNAIHIFQLPENNGDK